MKIVCCVCKKLIEIKKTGNPNEDALISHSYCLECYEKETDEYLQEMRKDAEIDKNYL